MNKKLKMLLGYVKGLNCNIEFIIQFYNYGNRIDYIDYWCRKNSAFQMASNMQEIFEYIAKEYAEKFYELGLGYGEGSDYFTVDGTIYPDKLIFEQTTFTQYGTEGSGSYYNREEFEDNVKISGYFDELDNFLDQEGVQSIEISYNGSGDDGTIEGTYSSDNKSGDITSEIKDICYNLLEEFGGWEINEGSQGKIIMTPKYIEIEHLWNTEDEITETLDIILKPENIS